MRQIYIFEVLSRLITICVPILLRFSIFLI
jgi:hypothetical protein